MIMTAHFSFLPHLPVYPAEFYQDGKFVRIKAPVAIDKKQPDLNMPRRFLDRLLSQELFSLNLYHDDGLGEKFEDCVVDRMTLICQTEDSADIDIIFVGEQSEADPFGSFGSPQPMRALTSHDLLFEAKSKKGSDISNRITKAVFHVDREEVGIKGRLFGVNRFLGDRRSPQIVEVLREDEDFRIDLGFKTDEGENWIFNLMDTKLALGRREIKDGLDRVEIGFQGTLC